MAWVWWICIYIYIYKERKAGWYTWTQLADDGEPTYRCVAGAVAVRWNGDTEYMAVLPDDFDESEVDTDDDNSACFHFEL